jgi:hypothetical protein
MGTEGQTLDENRPRTWERRIAEARKKHRPKLLNWQRDGFATTRLNDFKALERAESSCIDVEDVRQDSLAGYTAPLRALHRIPYESLSYDDFVTFYERPAIPCVIRDVPFCEEWAAASRWSSWSEFRRVGERYFKVGEDDDGYSVKVVIL